MNQDKRALAFRVLIMIISFVPVQVLSQADSQAPEVHSDSSKNETSRHSLYSSLGYGSNLIYLGSTISQNQPYGYAALTYGYRDKLYFTVSAVHLHERSPFIAFSSGSINYNHTFNSWFDISAGISGYLVAPSLSDTLFGNFLYGDLTLGIDWRLLYTKISVGGLVMDGINPYLQLRNSRYFKTPEFSKKDLFFSFDPYFNFLFGSLTRTETTTGTIINISPPYRKGGKHGQTSSTTEYTELFSIMEVDFGLPVSFNSDHITVEAEPGYLIPFYDDPQYPGLKRFVFTFSVYFRIF
jgi:hypothetical protein